MIELVVEGDHSPVDVADQLDVSLDAVYPSLAYYREHPEEMRRIRRSHEGAERSLTRRTLATEAGRVTDAVSDRRHASSVFVTTLRMATPSRGTRTSSRT